MNTKHQDILKQQNVEKKTRGRPRKYAADARTVYEKEKYTPFFESEKRKKKEGEKTEEMKQSILEEIFKDVYEINKGNYEFKYKYKIAMEHPVIKKIIEKNYDKNCDSNFSEYFNYCYDKANLEYIKFLGKFILLFRESINLTKYENLKKESNTDNEAWTASNNSDEVPEHCNAFFSEFLDSNNNSFGFQEDEKLELIELVQHFCFWLYKSNYTSSRLSLASN